MRAAKQKVHRASRQKSNKPMEASSTQVGGPGYRVLVAGKKERAGRTPAAARRIGLAVLLIRREHRIEEQD